MILLIGTYLPFYGQITNSRRLFNVQAGYFWIWSIPVTAPFRWGKEHYDLFITSPNIKLLLIEFVVATVIVSIALFLARDKGKMINQNS
jgi:hypothetical protein